MPADLTPLAREPVRGPIGGLLRPEDPPAAFVLNAGGNAPVVLLGDHAGQAIPAALGTLGLDEEKRARHIAWDIGIAAVAEHVARELDAVAVLSGYSRLVIDCNRRLDDPTSICEISDDVVVPGNLGLSQREREQRAEACFFPYHATVSAEIDKRRRPPAMPALISLHSFTPVFGGVARPWHVGVLWHHDPRIPVPLMARLVEDPALCVGDNAPYSGHDERGYSVRAHAQSGNLPHALLEIRQDLIGTAEGAAAWGARIAEVLRRVLADPAVFRPWPE